MVQSILICAMQLILITDDVQVELVVSRKTKLWQLLDIHRMKITWIGLAPTNPITLTDYYLIYLSTLMSERSRGLNGMNESLLN